MPPIIATQCRPAEYVMSRIEEILKKGTAGEIICSSPGFEMSYNAVVICAHRYLLDGPDTLEVAQADIDWSTWPSDGGGKLTPDQKATLPEHYAVMEKGFLLNFLKWSGKKIPKQYLKKA